MPDKHQNTIQCQICKLNKSTGEVIKGELVREKVIETIKNLIRSGIIQNTFAFMTLHCLENSISKMFFRQKRKNCQSLRKKF